MFRVTRLGFRLISSGDMKKYELLFGLTRAQSQAAAKLRRRFQEILGAERVLVARLRNKERNPPLNKTIRRRREGGGDENLLEFRKI